MVETEVRESQVELGRRKELHRPPDESNQVEDKQFTGEVPDDGDRNPEARDVTLESEREGENEMMVGAQEEDNNKSATVRGNHHNKCHNYHNLQITDSLKTDSMDQRRVENNMEDDND